MKVVAVFALCAVLAGVASASPLPEDSAVVQLVNKVLSQLQSAELQSQQQQDAKEQSLLSKLRNMAMIQDVLQDDLRNSKQQDVEDQGLFGQIQRWK